MSQEELTMGMIEEIDDGDVEECPLPYKVEKGSFENDVLSPSQD